LTLVAVGHDPDGTVSGVEFFQVERGATNLLGKVGPAPYAWSFDRVLTEGPYTFVARATDNAGASAWSAPVTSHAIDVSGDLLVIGDATDGAAVSAVKSLANPFSIPKANDLFSCYLPQIRVLAEAGLHFGLVAGFRAIIYAQRCQSAPQILPNVVDALWEAWSNGIPLYLIGERLPEAGADLEPAARKRWETLIGMTPAAGSSGPGEVTLRFPESEGRVNELFTSNICGQREKPPVTPFASPRSIPACTVLEGGEIRADLNGVPVLIRHPAFEEPERPFLGARLVLRLCLEPESESGDEHSAQQRSSLLQNGIMWLLGARCENFAASLTCSPVEDLQLCVPQRLTATLSNNGACAAGGVIVTQDVPEGLRILGASIELADQGDPSGEVRIDGQRIVFGVGQVGSRATIALHTWVAAEDPGNYVTTYERRARFKDDLKCEVPLTVTAALCQCPRLDIRQDRDALVLVLLGTCQVSTELEESHDLLNWSGIRRNPPLPDQTSVWTVPRNQPGGTFYRLRIVP
jgi:hypothetical protein